MELEIVSIEKPDEMNIILGQSHFIRTVEDLHEALVTSSPLVKFGLVETRAIQMAFSEQEWAALKGRIEPLTPCDHLTTVEEVGELVSLLDGPCADWFHGATIDFTGGQAQSLLDLVFHPPR